MKRNLYFSMAFATMCAMPLVNLQAQKNILEDATLEEPAAWGSIFDGEENIVIAGATITFGNEAMNSCAFPLDTVRLYDGAKVVMFDSPTTWYPNAEDPTYNITDFQDDLVDENGNVRTASPFNYKIMGDVTIDCDSKARIAGSISTEDNAENSTLTLIVGDSTVLDMNTTNFKGKLIIAFKSNAQNNEVLLGNISSTNCPKCGNLYNKASSAVCWDGIPWVLQVPDGTTLTAYQGVATALPAIEGRVNVNAGSAWIFLRTSVDHTYHFGEFTGGSSARNFEIYSSANITINDPIDYVGTYAYPRNKNVGVWVNSTDSCFTGIMNELSVRNNDGFVGGNGLIACGLACKSGTTTHVYPGAGFDEIGDLTFGGSIYLENNNAIDIDFGANGVSDRLIVAGARNPKCNISGANTRIWVNLLPEFYTSPKAGDYKVIVASEFVPNNEAVYDSTQTYPRYNETQVDSILQKRWANLYASEEPADKELLQHYSDSLTALFNYVVDHYIINQNVAWKANKNEDGTSKDSLPEGYSWYPTEWDALYPAEDIPAMRDSLINKKFFEGGVISIYGPGYVEGNIVNGPTAINKPVADDPNKVLVESQLYTVDGRRVANPVKGINIIRNRYSDGTIVTKKFIGIGD